MRVQGAGCRVQVAGCRVQGLGLPDERDGVRARHRGALRYRVNLIS